MFHPKKIRYMHGERVLMPKAYMNITSLSVLFNEITFSIHIFYSKFDLSGLQI